MLLKAVSRLIAFISVVSFLLMLFESAIEERKKSVILFGCSFVTAIIALWLESHVQKVRPKEE